MKIVLVTGGFDPIHSGHIDYLNAASKLGDKLIVGLNSDGWIERKKGRAFMPMHERLAIVSNIKCVDETIIFNDNDGSACDAIQKVYQDYPNDQIIFANGGDRTKNNIPEMIFDYVEFAFGVGGTNKKNSSSWILKDWKSPLVKRQWGEYRILYDDAVVGRHTKVKELVVQPGKSLSLQRHENRNEFWHVVEGICNVHSQMPGGYNLPARTLKVHDRIDIPIGEWHRLENPFTSPCKVIEIQFGSGCLEEDIERKSA
jgi:cytidyltransferase-like protein